MKQLPIRIACLLALGCFFLFAVDQVTFAAKISLSFDCNMQSWGKYNVSGSYDPELPIYSAASYPDTDSNGNDPPHSPTVTPCPTNYIAIGSSACGQNGQNKGLMTCYLQETGVCGNGPTPSCIKGNISGDDGATAAGTTRHWTCGDTSNYISNTQCQYLNPQTNQCTDLCSNLTGASPWPLPDHGICSNSPLCSHAVDDSPCSTYTKCTAWTCENGWHKNAAETACEPDTTCTNLCADTPGQIATKPSHSHYTETICSSSATPPCNNNDVNTGWACDQGYHNNASNTGCDPDTPSCTPDCSDGVVPPTHAHCTNSTSCYVDSDCNVDTKCIDWACNNGYSQSGNSCLQNSCAPNPLCYTNNWCTLHKGTPMMINQAWMKDALNCGYTCDVQRFGQNCEVGPAEKRTIKITGLTASKVAFSNADTIQSPRDMQILGGLTKLQTKQTIRRNIFIGIKNILPTTRTMPTNITNLTSPSGSQEFGKVIPYDANSSLVYITKGVGWVGLGSDAYPMVISGQRTLVVVGDIYIKGNLYYADASSQLAVVALRDGSGNGGNIYIDPNITNLVGTFFADKSVLSYEDGIGTLNATDYPVLLKNQLYIYGSILSENTIGGADSICPSYEISCTITKARQEDFALLRSYRLQNDMSHEGNLAPIYNGKVAGGATCDPDTMICENGQDTHLINKFTKLTDNDFSKYAIIVEYNSKVIFNPPPLLKIDK